jgi:hypothetical protein
MGQEVKNIKKNSNALERFIMYLIISESIKMNSNIKIEIIDTIPGKEAFQEIMDSIENGINDSFEMIPEKDLEEIIKLHKAKESLSLLLPEYNNIQDELDIKIKEKKEIEDNFLKDNEEIEEKVLKANEELINETSWTRKKLGETWYAQYSSNKKPKNKFFRWAVQSLFWTFVVPFLVVFIQEMGFFGNELAESLFKFTVIAGIALSGGFVAGGIAFWIHQKIFLKKVKNLESSKEKASIQLNDRIEKGADLSQIKSAMTLLVEKLNSIIPENITNEIEAMVKKIYDKHKDLKNYIDLDLLPSIIFAHTKNEVK